MQLKQIRDAVDPRLAACESVHEFPVELEKWIGSGILRPAEVTINATASWPIASTLGLPDVFTCWLPYWQQVDFKMDKGELVQP